MPTLGVWALNGFSVEDGPEQCSEDLAAYRRDGNRTKTHLLCGLSLQGKQCTACLAFILAPGEKMYVWALLGNSASPLLLVCPGAPLKFLLSASLFWHKNQEL